MTAVPPSQPATAILPLPRPPLSPPPPPTPSSSPRPAAPRRAAPRRTARVPYVMASRPLGPPRAAVGRCRSRAHVLLAPAGTAQPVSPVTRSVATLPVPGAGQAAALLASPARRTSPRAGWAMGQVSPPRTRGAASEAKGVARLGDPGFWHPHATTHSFLCVITVHLLDWQLQGEQNRNAAANFCGSPLQNVLT